MKHARLFRAGIVLGAGLGGFIDGIVLHQILGWHHLICQTETCRPDSIAALQLQNTQDGYFHLATLLLTIVGVVLAWRAHRETPARGLGGILAGGSIAGWGAFNLVEGLVSHQILGIHHVMPASPYWLIWDMAFLASGALLIGIGAWIAGGRGRGATRPPGDVAPARPGRSDASLRGAQ